MGGWRGTDLILVVTVILSLGISAAGCGGAGEPTSTATTGEFSSEGGDDPETAGDGDQAATPEDQGEAEIPEGENEPEDTAGQGGESLSWVPFGPSDPDIPTPSWPAYNAFASGDCATLENYTAEQDLGTFGRAMVALCAAAVDGEDERWDDVAAFAGGDPSALANDCLAQLVSDLINRALDWHERNPGRTPDVDFMEVPGQTECGSQSAAASGTDSAFTEDSDTSSTEPPDSGATAAPEVSATTSGGSSDPLG